MWLWLWLWLRLCSAANALIQPLAWEPPYAAGMALKSQKKKKKKKKFPFCIKFSRNEKKGGNFINSFYEATVSLTAELEVNYMEEKTLTGRANVGSELMRQKQPERRKA